tara:strand:- start:1845 stop:2114 length:270 start_codon:yes stop_codon:yes gene_type:complete
MDPNVITTKIASTANKKRNASNACMVVGTVMVKQIPHLTMPTSLVGSAVSKNKQNGVTPNAGILTLGKMSPTMSVPNPNANQYNHLPNV